MSGKILQKLVNAGMMKCIVPFIGHNAIAYVKNGKLFAWDRPDGKYWVHKSFKV